MTTTKIVAAVVDTGVLTMYKEDGSTITIQQTDPRCRDFVNQVAKDIPAKGYSEIDFSDTTNAFKAFEEKSSGFKLFKVARSMLTKLFGKEEPLPDMKVGNPVKPVAQDPELMAKAVAEIMQHATPVASPEFNMTDVHKQQPIEVGGFTPQDKEEGEPVKKTHTIIAVTPENKVVANVEQIENQLTRSVASKNIKGVEAFLKRVATVAYKRHHSAQDLLKFLERGDLPIADDGSILIFKVLNKTGSKAEEPEQVYVDCHTGNVRQWVGARVCMDESLVDHNRNNECSNGLHVARRGYIRHFSGTVGTLCKVAPEDVIAVPKYDANKMRVSAYHIIAELTPAQFTLIQQNKPMTDDPAGAILLAKAIAGDHISVTHECRIGGSKGAGMTYTPFGTAAPEAKKEEVPEVKAPVEPAKALESNGVEQRAEPMKVAEITELAKTVPEPVKKAAPVVVTVVNEGSPKARIQNYINMGITPTNAKAILAIKKAAKKGWAALGVSDKDAEKIVKASEK